MGIHEYYNEDDCEYAGQTTKQNSKKKKNETPTDKQCQWARNGQNFYPSYPTEKGLPAGQYTINFQQGIGYYFVKSKTEMDELFILEDSITEDVMSAMKTFWASEQKYRNFGFLWKRGVLLYGPPGTGKTSAVQLLAKEVENIGGISIYLNNPDYFDGLKTLREIEPEKPLVVILEDIDSLIDTYGESDILSLLDGEMQLDNIVFVATTNYINKLPGRIKNRPSRFDYLRKVGYPTAANRAKYIMHKNPSRFTDNEEELNKWVAETENFPLAHIKELIISVECLDVSFEVAAKRLQALIQSEQEGDMDLVEDVFNSDVKTKAFEAIASAGKAIARFNKN
jgi:DNA replication protein DnaC